MGQVVKAKVSLIEPEDSLALAERMRSHCLARLAKYKIPVRFTIVSEEEQRNVRFKKIRGG